MSDCRYNGRTEPRTVPGRHDGACNDEACPGCAPCPRAHCRICGTAHDAGTCPECMAETREALREIGRMCDALPEEVEHRGVEGEAMMLLGPAANPEARGHLEASALAGRIDPRAIEGEHFKDCESGRCLGCAGELHPEVALGGWEDVWRDALDHDAPPERFDLSATVDYLDRTMTYMGTWPHVPFEDFAKDLRRCLNHLKAVEHDVNHGDRANVGCFECGGDLERRLTEPKPCRHSTTERRWLRTLLTYPEVPVLQRERQAAKGACPDCASQGGFEDHWTCTKCKRQYAIAEYNFALRASIEDATKDSA